MPNASLVTLGTNHPYPVRDVNYPGSALPTDAMAPDAPIPLPPDLDTYLRDVPPAPHDHAAQHFTAVTLKPASFVLHPRWAHTPMGAAMHGSTLHLTSVTPAMFKALTVTQRTVLMDALSRDNTEISWKNAKGRRQHRTKCRWYRLRLGHPFTVNGATALTLLMAQYHQSRATRRAMDAGLPWVVDSVRGKKSTLFTLRLTASTLQHVLPRLTAPAVPETTRQWMNAAGTLVQRYLEQNTDETPISIRHATLRLLQVVNTNGPHNAIQFGAMVGTVLAGGLKYCANLNNEDIARRWRRTAGANLLWAAQNANPFFFVAGPVSLVAVTWATTWERCHAPRAYSAAVQHVRGELGVLIAQGRTPYAAAEVGEVQRWVRLAQNLNGLG